MNNISTSIEQSKKLIELGIDANTANMYWWAMKDGFHLSATHYSDEIKKGFDTHKIECIPAWSLGGLLELMPSEFSIEGKLGTFTYEIHIRKYKGTNGMDLYQIAYGNYGSNGNSWKDMINTLECENLIDAAFEMVCWLKENGNI